MPIRLRSLAPLLAVLVATPLPAWDLDGHRMVNEVALASLPKDFPAFVHSPQNAGRIAFLSSEPDRWSHASYIPLKHDNWPDHFLDIEQLPAAGIDPATLPSFRYLFAVTFANGRAAHPENFPPIDPAKNADHTREWPGFLPWATAESFGKLQAAFSALKAYEQAGTPEEIANAQANVVYYMGTMGHYVGDAAQPLHTTIHHNGWVGPNPNGYTTWTQFHSWVDSGFIIKSGMKFADIANRVKPAEPIPLIARGDGRDPFFVSSLDFLLTQFKLVEPTYQLEHDGKFGNGDRPVTDEARAFISARLLAGGQQLGAGWLTAWRSAQIDSYLLGQLLKRKGQPAPAANAKTHP